MINLEYNNKFYASLSSNYDLRYSGAEGDYHKALETDLLRSMIDVKNKSILDIGTGTGRLIFEFAQEAAELTGIDISSKMIEIAKGKNTNPSKCKFLLMDARNLEFNTSHFDIVFSFGSFEFVENLIPYLEQVNKVLKSNGEFVFTCLNKYPLFGVLPRKETVISHSFLDLKKSLEDSGFDVKKVISSFFIPFQLVWGAYFKLTSPKLKMYWIKLIISIETFFLKIPFLRYKGMQFMFLCVKR